MAGLGFVQGKFHGSGAIFLFLTLKILALALATILSSA